MKTSNPSNKIHNGKIIGSFFLLAFFCYGLGQNSFSSDSLIEKYIGAFLIVINSGLVFFIGFLLRKTLMQYNPWVGNIYFLARFFEALFLASVVLI